MIAFNPFAHCEPGLICHMLAVSYESLLSGLRADKVTELLAEWRAYDTAVFEEPDTVGQSGFVTLVKRDVIGFASWNPTSWPSVGIVGHNCVLPEYQGKGYGRLQIGEILRRFTEAGFAKARVLTDEHPFFAAARRMYERCGFEEVCRYPSELSDEYLMIEYERPLARETTVSARP